MSQAAELLGVQAAFLRSLDSSGVLQPHRSPGGHRRYSRAQLVLAAGCAACWTTGTPSPPPRRSSACRTNSPRPAPTPSGSAATAPSRHRAPLGGSGPLPAINPRGVSFLAAAADRRSRHGGPPRTTVDRSARRPDHQHGYIHRKDEYLKRLRRIEGQARGLQRMVEDEKYCIDILTQVSAMTKALQAVALGLLEEHLSHCVVDAAPAGGREADEKVREASEAIARLVRS